MSKQKNIIILIVLGVTFVMFVTLIISFRNVIREYIAVVSSISTFLYLTFNCIIVYINVHSLNSNTLPFVVVSFEAFEDGKGYFTLKNIGNSAGVITSFVIEEAWLEKYFNYFPDMPESEKKFMRELKNSHIVLPPKIKVILKMKFEPKTIIDTQLNNAVDIYIKYKNTNNQKFSKTIRFDFTHYSEMYEYESVNVTHKGIATGEMIDKKNG